jgi:type II secretory pathway component HofQ
VHPDESVRTQGVRLFNRGFVLIVGLWVVSAATSGVARSETDLRRVTIDVQDAEIGRVLDIIARVSGLNMVVGREVRGRVTVRVREIPWPQALGSILRANGYDYVREENVIRVDTEETLRGERAARIPRRAC